MLDGVHTAVCDLDSLVQRHKRGLHVNESQKTLIKDVQHQKNKSLWIQIFIPAARPALQEARLLWRSSS